MWFIRPNFKSDSKGYTSIRSAKSTNSKPKKQTTWNWEGKFTANATIKVRTSPGLKSKVVRTDSWIYKNQWVNFDRLIKKNGYWWVRFKYPTNPSAGHFYMAVAKITDKKERIKKEKNMFGKIKWK